MHRAPLPAQILGVPGVHLHGDEYRGGPCPEELASQEKCAGSKDRRFPSCIVLSLRKHWLVEGFGDLQKNVLGC